MIICFKKGLRKKIILLSLILTNVVEQPTPEVIIEQGIVRGRINSDGTVFEYLGIPYSTANKTNRFKEPYPPPKWDGVYNAINEHFRCPQRFGSFLMGQEDCLKVNVFTPSNVNSLLPVMVFIHGGGYFENSASPSIYSADYFLRHDVVVVTLNYRLGALGFLCLRTKDAPGNIGIRDQLAALVWVKNNIKAFGGNPDEVTLFGESAGGSSVSFLKQSPLSKGLFKKAIIQSGSSLGAWSIDNSPIETAQRLTRQFGFDTKDPSKLLDIYKSLSVRELVTTDIPKPNTSIVTSRLIFIPCIEIKIDGIENIITEHPFNKLTSGQYNDMPVMSGFNDREGIFLVAKETPESLAEKNNSTYLPSNLKFKSDKERLSVFKKIRKLYFGNEGINTKTLLNLADLYSDVFFIMPSIFEAEIVSKTSNTTQFNYLFKYSGYRNLVKFISGFFNVKGASHADELFYLYNSKLFPFKFGSDQIIIDQMTAMWTNFAKYGNPTPSSSDLLPIKWIPSERNNLKFLNIDESLSMDSVPNAVRSSFWNETYSKYRKIY